MKKTLESTLIAWGLGLISSWAYADVFLIGTPEGRPGDEVELSLAAASGTTLVSIDITPTYEGFDKVLSLIVFQETPALTAGGSGLCIDGLCSFFYLQGKSFAEEAVLATWRFRVASDAAKYANADGTVPFDLGVVVSADPVSLPGVQAFSVMPVPEPSSSRLLVAGILLLIGGGIGDIWLFGGDAARHGAVNFLDLQADRLTLFTAGNIGAMVEEAAVHCARVPTEQLRSA